MTVPSYTEDLTDIATGDEAAGWTVFSTNEQGSPTYEDNDYPYIQGNYAVCQTCSKSKTIGNLGYDYGSDTNPGTDDAILVWQNFSTPTAIDDYVGTTTGSAGMSILIGNSTSNFDIWYIGGSDVSPYPYGGWTCHAVCPSVTADDATNGPRTSEQVIGAQVALIAYPSKGEPHAIDVMRFGRCSSIFQDGQAANYCTVAGFAAQNDNSSNRWGLLQEVSGGYLWQGRMLFGSTNACNFVDSDKTIFVKYTPKVTSNFNTIDNNHASNSITITGFQFICLDPTNTASKGRWISTANGTASLTDCLFQDMDIFTFDSNTTLTTCTFTRCGQITQAEATITSCLIQGATTGDGVAALVSDDITSVTGTEFVFEDGHAIELTSAHAASPTELTVTNLNFTGAFVGTPGSNLVESSGSTDATIYNNSGKHLILNITGGDNPSIRNSAGSTTTVNISVPISISIVDKDNDGIVSVTVSVHLSSNDSEIINSETDAFGDVSGSFSGTTPAACYVRARKSSGSGGVNFVPNSTTATLATSTGLTLTMVMQEDTINTT